VQLLQRRHDLRAVDGFFKVWIHPDLVFVHLSRLSPPSSSLSERERFDRSSLVSLSRLAFDGVVARACAERSIDDVARAPAGLKNTPNPRSANVPRARASVPARVPHTRARANASARRARMRVVSSSSASTSVVVETRARSRARGRAVGHRRRGASTRDSRALPPANEIAGFVVGAALVGLCFGGATLDGAIARAQAAGMEEGDGARGRGRTTRRGTKGGNVFVVPDDDEGGVGRGA
jgi:hypothetical protein